MKIWIILLVGAASVSGFAATGKCSFKSISEFKKQLLKDGPVLREIAARKKHAGSFVEKAKQRPNPLVETEYSKGEQFGVDVNTYRVKALHTIELGDKREARIRESLAKQSLIESQLSLNKAGFVIQGLTSYRRAQQLELQISSVKEALETFQSIISKLSSRKRLTPEERVSLSTLKLAVGDYQGRLHELKHEKETLIVDISYWASCEDPAFAYKSEVYPKLPRYKLNPGAGQAKIAQMRAKVAQTEYEAEKALGYSDLAVGPLLVYQEQGSETNFSAGVGVTFSAPIFHTNDGGKEIAARKFRERRLQAKNQMELLRGKLKKELHVYEDSLKSLSRMPNPEEVAVKRKEAEKLFKRGVISIPMVIESHRQHIEYLRSLFEIENDVLKSLKEIYLLTENKDLISIIFEDIQ